jgi:Tetracyclin repressor-like, C-terminal domain
MWALEASYAVFDEPGACEGDAPGRLRYVIRRQCEVLGDHVAESALMIRARGNTDTEKWVVQQRRTLNQRVQQYVQDAIDAGYLDERLDPAVATRLMFGTLTSTVDWYRPDERLKPADLARQVELLLFNNASS